MVMRAVCLFIVGDWPGFMGIGVGAACLARVLWPTAGAIGCFIKTVPELPDKLTL